MYIKNRFGRTTSVPEDLGKKMIAKGLAKEFAPNGQYYKLKKQGIMDKLSEIGVKYDDTMNRNDLLSLLLKNV